jgi:hypothetical protein
MPPVTMPSRRTERRTNLPDSRLRHLARQVHALGERPLFELFRELANGDADDRAEPLLMKLVARLARHRREVPRRRGPQRGAVHLAAITHPTLRWNGHHGHSLREHHGHSLREMSVLSAASPRYGHGHLRTMSVLSVLSVRISEHGSGVRSGIANDQCRGAMWNGGADVRASRLLAGPLGKRRGSAVKC